MFDIESNSVRRDTTAGQSASIFTSSQLLNYSDMKLVQDNLLFLCTILFVSRTSFLLTRDPPRTRPCFKASIHRPSVRRFASALLFLNELWKKRVNTPDASISPFSLSPPLSSCDCFSSRSKAIASHCFLCMANSPLDALFSLPRSAFNCYFYRRKAPLQILIQPLSI